MCDVLVCVSVIGGLLCGSYAWLMSELIWTAEGIILTSRGRARIDVEGIIEWVWM